MSEANPNARLEMFCDGVFAIALTLLIIDIKIPATAEINSTAALFYTLMPGFRKNFAFDNEWNGTHYALKQLEAYAVYEKRDWTVITVIVKYF